MAAVQPRSPQFGLLDGARASDAAAGPGHRRGQHVRERGLDPHAGDLEVGQALADVATVGLLQERSIREARVVAEQLQGALTSRVVIEQAKGMVVAGRKVSMDVAFESMRGYARSANRRLSDVAKGIIDGTVAFDDLH